MRAYLIGMLPVLWPYLKPRLRCWFRWPPGAYAPPRFGKCRKPLRPRPIKL